MLVPVDGGSGHRLAHLLPGLESTTLQGQGAQDLPSRLNQIELGGDGLEDELPARMDQRPAQDIERAMGGEIVEHGVHPPGVRIKPRLDVIEEIDPVGDGAAGIEQGEGGSARGRERAEDIPRAPAPRVDLLLRPSAPPIRGRHLDQPLPGMTLGRLWSHLAQTNHETVWT